MTTTPELDRAIVVAQERVFNNQERVVDPFDRTYARALIAELLRGMEMEEVSHTAYPIFTFTVGHNGCLAEIRRRAGLEGEG